MTNLSDLFPAGAGKQVSFVADGTLSNGQAVALKADGTVEAVAVTGFSISFAAPFVASTGNAFYLTSVYDSTNNKVVIAYSDNAISDDGYSVVADNSSAGTPVVFDTANSNSIAAAFDSNAGKVVIAYKGASGYGTAIVGTVSGTSISYGTPVVFNGAGSDNISATFDSDSNQVVIAYRDHGNSYYGTAIVGAVSGTTISYGTAVAFQATNTQQTSMAFDSDANKVVIAYKDDAGSLGKAIVGTVSGTAISFGTAVTFESAAANFCSSTFDSASNKVVISYQDAGNSDYGTAIVGTVSGTAISFGTAVVFEAAATAEVSSTFDTAGGVAIAYKDQGNSSYGTAIVGTVSGTAISFGTPVVFETANTTYTSAVFDTSTGKVVISYQDNGSTGDATVSVGTLSGIGNNASFIGIADAAISDTASGNVTIKGGIAASGLSSLTPASDYYVQADGTISTSSAGTKIGKAMSATSINLEYQS